MVRSLTLDQIKEAGWKLQVKEEEKKVEYTGEYDLRKLGDVCDLLSGKTNNARGEGNIPFYDSNGQIAVVNDYLYDGEFVITARVLSIGSVHYVSGKFWAGDNTINIRVKDGVSLSTRFFYNWLNSNTHLLKGLSSGIKPYIRKSDLAEILMPIPPLPIQQEIVSNLDRIFADPQDMKDCLAFTDKAMDLMLKDPSGKALEDLMGALRLKRSQLVAAASIKAQMAAVMRCVGARGYKKKKLEDLCDLLSGKGGNYQEDGNTYPYYDSNGITGYRKDFCFEGDHIITARKMSIGAVHFASGKFWSSDNTINIRIKDATVLSTRFFYLWLLLNNKALKDLSSGIKPGIRKSEVAEILMPLPPLPIQEEVLTILNEMEADVKVMEQMAAKAEQRAKYILEGYLTSQSQPTAEPIEEVVEPVAVPQNTLVSSTPEPVVPAEPTEPPKPAKKVFKLKKGSS